MLVRPKDLLAELLADRPIANRARQLYIDLGAAWDTPKRWSIIREYYRIRAPQIEAGGMCPYELGLERWLTPIEWQLWQDLRGIGLPFYMQYPVGRRFVDFGDPLRQIAIEADGARYHTPEKDAIKTRELQEAGWWVIRIKGRDTFGVPGTNRIREMAREHYGYSYDPIPEDDDYQ